MNPRGPTSISGSVSGSGNPAIAKDHGSLRGVRDEGLKVEVLRAGIQMDWGGVRADA